MIKRIYRRYKPENPKDGAVTGWFSSSFLIANILIGIGILNYPAAFKDSGGILPAVTFQIFCVAFVILGELLMAACSDLSGSDTYQDTVSKHCGKMAQMSCSFLIVTFNFGVCILLMVILADQLDGSAFGYLTFGDRTTTDVLTSYPPDWMVLIALVITGIKAVTSYPVVMFCVRQVIDEEICRVASFFHLGSCHSDKTRHALTSLTLFIISLFLTLVVPSMGSMVSLLGGIAALLILFYPGLCYMQAYKDCNEKWSTCKVTVGVMMVSLGVFTCITATLIGIDDFQSGQSKPDNRFCQGASPIA
ncbi:hypothetical protein LSH36_852g01036 [Paralvinella palmiformis]|uniref:Amino acid transporter transmembrane domain-containing protein n=1 Tax=Paralvinella palmiformis TaxID=53620 RepID=A0AAD9MS29_9ANNE|nr:hypothetical protein LSH36_852g01036 [Paralvinella palmiformis]